MKRSTTPGAALVVSIGAMIFAAPVMRDDPARQTLLTMLVDAQVIEAGADPVSATLEVSQGFVPLGSFKHRLDPAERKVFQDKDGWGREILYWSDGWNYMLLSRGSDGLLEVDYGASTPPYREAPAGLTTDPSQDILVVNGAIQRGPFLSRQAAPSSLAALRAIGTACEEYGIDNNFYPSAGTTLSPVSAIASPLSPTYIRVLPLLDGWGRTILYWTDIAGRPVATNYAVISVGADGVADHPYESWTFDDFASNGIGTFTDLRRDTIFLDGQFVQSPEQSGTPIDAARSSMAWMRSIATACEEYAIDNNFYPSSGGGVIPVSSLMPFLTPVYIKVLPATDGWNQPLIYYSNTSSYWIISTGSDRIEDHPYESWGLSDFQSYPGGPVTTLDKDIIFENGQFIQYPQFLNH